MSIEQRVDRLEVVNEQILLRLDSIDHRMDSVDNRLNVQLQITVAMWVTTMMAVLAVLAAIIIKS